MSTETYVRTMARTLMRQYNLDDEGWRFEWDRAVKRAGATHYSTKRITMSRAITLMGSDEDNVQTILHEIAHALAGSKAGHGPEWRKIARQIGSNAKRTHSMETPTLRYTGTCPHCGTTTQRARSGGAMLRTACAGCCRRYARGRYDERFKFQWVDNTTRRMVG